MAQQIFEAFRIDDDNVETESEREGARLDDHNLETPPGSRPGSRQSSRPSTASSSRSSSSYSSSSSSSSGGLPPALTLALRALRPSQQMTAREQTLNILRGIAAPFVLPSAASVDVVEALQRQFHGARSGGASIQYLQPQHGEADYRPVRRRSGRSGGALAITAA